MNTLISVNQPSRTAWRALTYFNLYRFLVAFLFVALYWIGQLPQPLGIYNEKLFAISANLYLVAAIISHFFIHIQKPPHAYQVAGQVFTDIILVTFMMYASAGLNSGFGMLLVITVAGGGLLKPGKIGILFASIATIMVLGHEVYAQFNRIFPGPNYIHAGFLGITFFITAFIVKVLAGRVEESEALAEKRAQDIEKLAQLNEHIVQRLQSGIIVLDDDFCIRLFNESAKRLLGIDKDIRDMHIGDVDQELGEATQNWKEGTGEQTVIIKPDRLGGDIQVSVIPLHFGQEYEILVFIEDLSVFRQHAQQLKLASLGRLTASIAHEVRNPLGAISHAGQLLMESESITQDDRRLTKIIGEHSQRVNQIIENIMAISRREQPQLVSLELSSWLKDFKKEFELRHKLKEDMFKLSNETNGIFARMDSLQFHQVLWNLAENAIRYSKEAPLVEINYAINQETQRPYVDVIDKGPGISQEAEEQLFEPFYTTNPKGSGLGLYIARELCEANQATLNIYSNTSNGCCFRIIFSHPDKQHRLI